MSAQQKIEEENLVDMIEDMIDLRMTMKEEKFYCNYRTYLDIKENQYDPLVNKIREKINKIGLDFPQK
jgi:hypothetical protein